MQDEIVQRNQYFDGECLDQEDFQVEQRYLDEMLRYHNRDLHTWGIAEGLRVSIGRNRQTAIVGSGMAIDAQGRELILANDRVVDLSGRAPGTYYLAIAYHETPCHYTDETIAQGARYVCENPEITSSSNPPVSPSQQLLLARIVLDSNRNITHLDLSLRRHAGINVGTLSFILPPVKPDEWPSIAGWDEGVCYGLEMNAAEVRFSDTLTVTGNVGIGTHRPAATLDVVASDLPFIARFRHAGATAPLLVIDPGGKVGIGTDAPRELLHVKDGNLGLADEHALIFEGDGQLISQDHTYGISLQSSANRIDLKAPGSRNILLQSGYQRGTNLVPSMILQNDGLVGIGTLTMMSSPKGDARLTVSGLIESTRGGLMFHDGSVQTTAAISTSVPVGTVLEWWRPDENIPVPEGFVICTPPPDQRYPNLEGRYILGTARLEDVGKRGGQPSHQHSLHIPSHKHPIPHTHYDVYYSAPQSNDGTDKDSWNNEDVLSYRYHGHGGTSVQVPKFEGDSQPYPAQGGPLIQTTEPHLNNPAYVGMLMILRVQ